MKSAEVCVVIYTRFNEGKRSGLAPLLNRLAADLSTQGEAFQKCKAALYCKNHSLIYEINARLPGILL